MTGKAAFPVSVSHFGPGAFLSRRLVGSEFQHCPEGPWEPGPCHGTPRPAGPQRRFRQPQPDTTLFLHRRPIFTDAADAQASNHHRKHGEPGGPRHTRTGSPTMNSSVIQVLAFLASVRGFLTPQDQPSTERRFLHVQRREIFNYLPPSGLVPLDIGVLLRVLVDLHVSRRTVPGCRRNDEQGVVQTNKRKTCLPKTFIAQRF